MWKVTIKPYVWLENKIEHGFAKIEFECQTLQEAVALVEMVREHSNITEFHMEYVGKEKEND